MGDGRGSIGVGSYDVLLGSSSAPYGNTISNPNDIFIFFTVYVVTEMFKKSFGETVL